MLSSDPHAATLLERVPPHSIPAEMQLLGSLMIADGHAETFAAVLALTERDHFFQPDHQIIFDIIVTIHSQSRVPTGPLVREVLLGKQLLEEVGGAAYLGRLLHASVDFHQAPEYAAVIRERWLQRQQIAIANDMLREAYGPQSDATAIEGILRYQNRLARLVQGVSGDGVQTLGEIVADTRESMSAPTGSGELIGYGYRAIDKEVGGLMGGEFCVIGARPSMGKSTLVKQMALRMGKAGIPVAVFSLEETKKKIGRNVLSYEARIENSRMRRPHDFGSTEWEAIDESIKRLKDLPVYATDKLRSAKKIEACLTSLVAKHGIKTAVFDYLQLIQAGGEVEFERATLSSQFVVNLAKDLGIRAIATSQLGRKSAEREDKRPTLTDLRNSGQIEQDADTVLLLHREDYYRVSQDPRDYDHKADLIVAKMRDGARGKDIKLDSDLRFQTFEDPPEAFATMPEFFERSKP